MTSYQYLSISILIITLLIGERLNPLRIPRIKPFRHYVGNLLIALPAFLVARFVILPVLVILSSFVWENHIGLSSIIDMEAWWASILIFVLYDYGFYLWHSLNHKIPFLWKFHSVHHIDVDLDTTTNFRFHFFEVFLSIFWRGSMAFLIGIPLSILLVYEFVFQASTLFHHSNIKLPLWMEKLLLIVIATPRLHGIHHSKVRQERDSNFAVIFIWWDLIHRTFESKRLDKGVDIGLPQFEKSLTITQALLLPVNKDFRSS